MRLCLSDAKVAKTGAKDSFHASAGTERKFAPLDSHSKTRTKQARGIEMPSKGPL
jgi:hypothetical protein